MSSGARQHLSIKGIRDGLLITLGEGPYDQAAGDLQAELAAKRSFLNGSRVAVAVGDRPLDRGQLAQLQDLFAEQGMALWAVLTDVANTKEAARELGLATRLPGSNVDLDGNLMSASTDEAKSEASGASSLTGANGLVIRETVRSGRSLFHEGHVIVIGDVNPGAEIIAGGDVVVWGRLRGLVHAGALGDTSAAICALELIPTQLRIADQIAISPREQSRRPVPERASVVDGQIVAEAWDARH